MIGLEVHAQVIAEAKLFSGAATAFGAEPNTQVSPVDAAFPGMLPVINRICVEQAVKTGLGLEARDQSGLRLRPQELFLRRPAGRAIRSRNTSSRSSARAVVLDLPDGATREIGITRLHLEQDAGKSLHDQHPSETYVDLNRAGVALMEIVSEPDLRSAEEAGAYLRKLRSILRYLGTCDGNMEEGSLRCDCNVSVRKPGEPLGTRCEIKNVNSIRFVMQAIEYEARRQIEMIEEGGTIAQETRLFDTAPRRDPADALARKKRHDYRYFPDPDLLPLVLERGLGRAAARRPARIAGRQEGALRRRLRAVAGRCRRAGRGAGDGRLFRGGGQGPRCQARGQLGDGRSLRRAQQARGSASRTRRSRPARSAR